MNGGLPAAGGLHVNRRMNVMSHRALTLALATALLAATPAILSLPAVLPSLDGIVPFLAGVASFYLGMQFYCGELAEV